MNTNQKAPISDGINKKTNIDQIILFSSGIDSTILAIQKCKEDSKSLLLHINYDHPAQRSEQIASFNIYQQLLHHYPNMVEYQSIKLPINAQSMNIGNGKSGSRVVPNRNAIMLNMAINIAVCNDIKVVEYGAVLDDLNDYVDCRIDFLYKINDIAQDWNVKIKAPFMRTAKEDILLTFDKKEHHLLDHCSSCYQPKLLTGSEYQSSKQWISCGTCNSCLSNNVLVWDQIVIDNEYDNEYDND